jgi:hypothetical protein
MNEFKTIKKETDKLEIHVENLTNLILTYATKKKMVKEDIALIMGINLVVCLVENNQSIDSTTIFFNELLKNFKQEKRERLHGNQ